MLCTVWAGVILLFFSLSTRQEYYVLPALPALTILIGGWLASRARTKRLAQLHRQAVRRRLTIVFLLASIFAAASLYFLSHTSPPSANTDLAQLLQQNPQDYALSMGHFLDLNAQALGLFRVPLAIAATSLFLGSLLALLLNKGSDSLHPFRLFISILSARLFPRAYSAGAGRKRRVHAGNLALAAGAFGFLLAAHLGLQTFAPVLTSAQLAKQIAPASPLRRPHRHPRRVRGWFHPGLLSPEKRHPHPRRAAAPTSGTAASFPTPPPIFETPATIAQKWTGTQRIFMWQSTTDEPRNLPALPGPVYILATGGGKEIVSNQPNR